MSTITRITITIRSKPAKAPSIIVIILSVSGKTCACATRTVVLVVGGSVNPSGGNLTVTKMPSFLGGVLLS